MHTTIQAGRRRLALAALIMSIFGIAACDGAESGTGRTTEMRCSTDGLCWSPVGKRSLEGAYRRGDDEIKFDAIFSPSRSAMTSFRDEWSYRLVDRLGHSFYEAHSSAPPDEWISGDPRKTLLPPGIEDEAAYLRSRRELAKEMAHAVVTAEGPGGRLKEPWDGLCHHLKVKYLEEEPIVTREGDSRDVQAAPAAIKKKYVDQASSVEGFVGAQSEDLVDAEEGGQEKEVWNGECDDENQCETPDSNDLEKDENDDSGESEASNVVSRHLSKFSAKLNKKTHPAEYHSIAGKEFYQEIDLYWKHTRSLLVAGWKTAKHHSAACIRVYQRRLGSDDPWEDFQEVCTENHGSQARTGEMMLYAKCRGLPITKEFFAWKGECGGRYPTHVCNDDTALQIRHAYGEWDGGNKCLKRKRMHRPWCEKPW